MLKSERIDITSRVDELATGIYETGSHISLRKEQDKLATEHAVAASRSPGQALRRIRSLEGRAHSYTQLHKIVRDSSDGEESFDKPSPPIRRKSSVPSRVIQSITSLHSPSAKKPISRTDSNSKRRSLQALETILDNSPHIYNIDTLAGDSPDSTPESSPKLVRVRSVHSLINRSCGKVLAPPRPSRSSSQTIYQNAYNTLPCRKTSSTSSSINDNAFSDSLSVQDSFWDECSLQSEGSAVFRISSATGQVEKVSRSMNADSFGKLNSNSIEKLNSPTLVAPLRRPHLSQSTYRGSYGYEETDKALRMNFTEEPRPLSLCLEPHKPSPVPALSPPKRSSSIILHCIETTV